MERTDSIDGTRFRFAAAVIVVALIAAGAIARLMGADSRSPADQFASLICADHPEPHSFLGE